MSTSSTSRSARPRPLRWPNAVAVALATLVGSVAFVSNVAHAAVSQDQRDMVDRVMQRLLTVVEEPEQYDAWPPQWLVVDEPALNAFATVDRRQRNQNNELRPLVRIYRGLLDEIVEMNEDRLAFVLAHELAHLTCGHVTSEVGDTGVLDAAFTREQELEADRVGMKYVVAAGYSYRDAMGAPQQFVESDHSYTSFEGIGTDHPSWIERLELLESDELQKQYWRAASSFQTGVFFLRAQNFQAAEFSFRAVTEEFPKCYEAWVNLGYAQLMQYCDALDSDDLESLGIGQLIVGGFYERMGGTRGPVGDIESLWWDAVGSFQRALTLKDDLLLAKADLALAYLVHPSGTPDLGQAARLYADVAELLEDEEATANIDPLTRAAMLANAWVGLYHNDESQNAKVLAQIEQFLKRAEQRRQTADAAASVRAALDYTRARSLAASGDQANRGEAMELLEDYLAATPTTSAWWSLAYDQYADLAKQLGKPAQAADELRKPRTDDWRIVTSVTTGDDIVVSLAAPIRRLAASLDETVEGERLFKRFGLKQYVFGDVGTTLIGGRDVIAIVLSGPNAPPVQLRRETLGAQSEQVAIGMPRSEVEALLGDAWTSTNTSIIDPDQRHEFYEDVGIAVRYGDDNTVVEIIVTVAPRRGGGK